jgi:hypothetical protein
MNPLILLAGNIFPAILDFIVGERGGTVTKAVIDAATRITGIADPDKAKEKIAQNPALADQLRIDLANIAIAEKKLFLDAQAAADRLKAETEANARAAQAASEAAARKDALEAAMAEQKAGLEAAMAAQKAELDQRIQDQKDTEGSRRMLGELIENRSMIAYAPVALSIIVTLGFFLIMILFVVLKGRLETTMPPTFAKETLDILDKLQPAQIAALVQPRSDFVIQIINICVGALAAAFATVISFWLGSSQSSRNKDVMVANLQERNAESQERQAQVNVDIVRQVTEAVSTGTAQRAPAPAEAGQGQAGGTGTGPVDGATSGASPGSGKPAAPDGGMESEPVKPAPTEIIIQGLAELTKPHRHFPSAASWQLTPGGIGIDGAPAQGTLGEPTTVRRIWKSFGPLCAASAAQWGVPVELIIATIATESDGNPNARRFEPSKGEASAGLMQTLVSAAREVTGRKSLTENDLFDPRTSIDAGTAHISSRRSQSHYDPPLVAAAYNAGSLQPEDAPANRWKLRCFPRNTGKHIDRFIGFFNDAMRVSAADGWSQPTGCPSFAAMLGGGAPAAGADQPQAAKPKGQAATRIASPAVIDINAPGFPPRPAFGALLTRAEKDALFGHFDYVPDPATQLGDGIRILGDWQQRNITTVTIPFRLAHANLKNPFRIQFHKAAEDQLVAMWLAWEDAGLIDRILTWDGDFAPRFQRPKKRPAPPPSERSLSNHAWGSAFDINAEKNGLGETPALIGKEGCVREMVPIANQHGFFWGGHFQKRLDGMHFEVAKLL